MELLEIGKITRIHGIKGAVKVVSFLEDFDYSKLKNVFIEKQPATVEKVLQLNGAYSIKFNLIRDANQAELYKNKSIYIDRDLYPDLKEKVFLSDLVGCKVLDEKENVLGEFIDFEDYGATVILTIKTGAISYQLPYVSEIIEYDKSKNVFRTTKQKFEDIRV